MTDETINALLDSRALSEFEECLERIEIALKNIPVPLRNDRNFVNGIVTGAVYSICDRENMYPTVIKCVISLLEERHGFAER